MRPRRRIEKHSLNIRRNRYTSPRHTIRHHSIQTFSTQNTVQEEVVERYGMDVIKNEMVKELVKEMLDSGMVSFTEESEIPGFKTIIAKINTIKNG